MRRLTIDFETFWDTKDGYSLSRMTAVEYINDPRFEIILVSVKLDDEPVRTFTGNQLDEFDAFLSELPTDEMVFEAQNGVFFDFLILGWVFGIRPEMWRDSMLLAKPLIGKGQSASLAKLAEWLGLPAKGTEIYNTNGKHLTDFSPAELDAYAKYCERDVDICRWVCDRLLGCWNERDLVWMHLCCNMGARPYFVLDNQIIEKGMADEAERHRNLYMELAEGLVARGIKLPEEVWRPSSTGRGKDKVLTYPTLDEAIRKSVSSIPMCSKLIEELGYEVPMKTSEKQGKRVPALAKSNPEFLEMADRGDRVLEALVESRLSSKSTIRMSRLTRLLQTSELMDRQMPIFLEPFAALTGRNAGKQKMNIQNFASRPSKNNPEGKANPMRLCMRAPSAHVVVDADSSQIEVRVLGALAGEPAITEPLARGEDIYCAFGTQLYGRPITKSKEDKPFRNVAKAAVLGNGYGQGGFGFQRYAKVTAGIELSLDESQQIVDDYRRINSRVRDFWRLCDKALEAMDTGNEFVFGTNGCLRVDGKSLILPSGRRIFYRELHWQDVTNPLTGQVVDRERVYWDPNKRFWKRIYGSLMCENICQATANDIISQQAYEMHRLSYSPAAQVHDALVYVVPVWTLPNFLTLIRKSMRESPSWMPPITLDMEAEVGPSYGEMKEMKVEADGTWVVPKGCIPDTDCEYRIIGNRMEAVR